MTPDNSTKNTGDTANAETYAWDDTQGDHADTDDTGEASPAAADQSAPKPAYEVGYRKPPKATRFKKGQSGNPKGRPKGSVNFSTDLKDTLNTKIVVKENGRPKTVSTQKAALLRLREKALSGDARALDRLLTLAGQYNDASLGAALTAPLPAEDQAILDNYANRLQRQGPQGENEASSTTAADSHTDNEAQKRPEAAPQTDEPTLAPLDGASTLDKDKTNE